jgi:hypothetical protein
MNSALSTGMVAVDLITATRGEIGCSSAERLPAWADPMGTGHGLNTGSCSSPWSVVPRASHYNGSEKPLVVRARTVDSRS